MTNQKKRENERRNAACSGLLCGMFRVNNEILSSIYSTISLQDPHTDDYANVVKISC